MDRITYISNQVQLIRNEITPTRLVAVTKYASVEDAVTVYNCGQYDLGEARVSQLQERANYFIDRGLNKVRWHFIGHLQTNKINRLLKVPNLTTLHSIDSAKLLEAIYDRIEHFTGEQLNFFLQIKTSPEKEKNGIETYDELSKIINFILSRNNEKLNFCGLMTMGPVRTENFEDDARDSFLKLEKIRKKLMKEYHFESEIKLSMGMSQDYKIAIDAGSHWVRIGGLLFPSV